MTALIAQADISNELQITFAAGYSDAIFTEICAWAESRLKRQTNRATFTGDAAPDAKMACVYLAIDRLATSNRDLVKVAIAGLSENGASITFNNGKTLESYKKEAAEIIGELKLIATSSYGITFADPAGVHTSSDPGMYDEV